MTYMKDKQNDVICYRKMICPHYSLFCIWYISSNTFNRNNYQNINVYGECGWVTKTSNLSNYQIYNQISRTPVFRYFEIPISFQVNNMIHILWNVLIIYNTGMTLNWKVKYTKNLVRVILLLPFSVWSRAYRMELQICQWALKARCLIEAKSYIKDMKAK